MLKIGLIDSGIGGFSVLKGLIDSGINAEYYYLFDNKYHPYGQKPQSELVAIGYACMQKLIEFDVDLVIIACNTLTSRAATPLRAMFKLPIIGVEPPIKPAAKYAENILLLATPSTIKSDRVCEMIHNFTSKNFYFPDMSRLANLIETNFANKQIIYRFLKESLKKYANIDGVVLGCTHYNFVRDEIQQLFKDAQIFSNIDGVVNRTKYIIAKNKLIEPQSRIVNVICTDTPLQTEKRNFLCDYLGMEINFEQ